MKVKIKRLHPDTKIPKQATEFAGGWDIVATEIIQDSKNFVICKLGFALELPANYKFTLVPRSSLTSTEWVLQNSPCLGDRDFSGEYQLRFRAIPNDVIYVSDLETYQLDYPYFPYVAGDRIGQAYLEEVIPMEFEEVEELTQTIRGNGKFGSTGK